MPNNHTRPETTYRLLGVTVNTSFCLPKKISVPFEVSPDLRFIRNVVESLPFNPAGTQPVYVSPYTLPGGESLLYAYNRPEYDMLRFTHTADFYVRPNVITCYQLRRASHHHVSRWLSSTVLALWLERKGTPVFHASAVSCNGDTDVVGHPGYPQMRLWADQAEHFLGHFEDLELVHPDATKRYVPVGPETLGSFCDSPRSLRCLYIPARRDPEDTGRAIEITPLSSGEAVIELVRYSFTGRLLAGLGLQAQRLKTLAQIVQRVAVRRIADPTGMEYLPGTCDAILNDLATLAD
jgi:hypothetical protein